MVKLYFSHPLSAGGGASPTGVRPKFGLSDGKPYTVKLANGVVMPQIGFGTAGLGCEKSYSSVLTALEVGYRHLDTAQVRDFTHEAKFQACS